MSSLNLGDLIAAGTHGQIYTIAGNPGLVAKTYLDSPLATAAPCPCPHITPDCGSTCKYASYEFQLQRLIGKALADRAEIRIPAVYDFETADDRCQYTMERIWPVDASGQLVQLDMSNADVDRTTPGVGRFLGWERFDPTEYGWTSIGDIAAELGQLFGILHFELHIDGYDCELVAGATHDGNRNLWLIDYDKAACFEFSYGGEVRRKLDESTVDVRKMRDARSIARLLFTAMTSMSLLPTDHHLKELFMSNYADQVGERAIEREVLEHVRVLVDNYTLD